MNVRLYKKILQNTFSIFLLATISSCVSSKEIIYFQDEPLNILSNVAINTEIAYKPNDLLTINVSAIDPETVRPFNLPIVTNNSTSLEARGDIRMQTYIIDQDGNIDFPVLGTLKFGGLTREEATLMLKKRISEFVKDPIINIRLTNFTVTVLGEVNNPGTYIVEEERISFIEALGLAGDLTIHGVRNNIFLIREENGVKRFTKFDLTSINVVNNPNYYLEQNDILYVEPNSARIRSASYNQNYVLIISAVGTLATIAAILIR